MGNEVFHAHKARLPSIVAVETTVQPVDVAIGTGKCSNLFCGQKVRNNCIAQDRINALVGRAPPQVLPDLTSMTPVLFVSRIS